jgi:hypothetical protein
MKTPFLSIRALPMGLLAAFSTVLVGPPFARPESLGEAAAREAARRKDTQSPQVFRQEDLQAAKGSTANFLGETGSASEAQSGEYEAYLQRMRAPRPQIIFEGYSPLSAAETARLRTEAAGQKPLTRLLSWEPGIAGDACVTVVTSDFARQHASELVTIIRDRGAPSGARQCAIFAATLSGGSPASGDLRQALVNVQDDSDRHIRRAVASMARVAFPSDQAVTHLARALRDPYYAVRGNAAVDLAALGPVAAAAVPALTEALEAAWPQENPGAVNAARLRMIHALRQIGPSATAAVPALRRVASKSNATGHKIQEAAQSALEAILGTAPPPPSVEERVARLNATLRSCSLDECGHIATSLGELGAASAPAVPALIEALEAKWPRPPRPESGIRLGYLEPPHPGRLDAMRVRVVTALGEIGPAAKAAIPALTRAAAGADSTSLKVPQAAQAALAAIQRPATPSARK